MRLKSVTEIMELNISFHLVPNIFFACHTREPVFTYLSCTVLVYIYLIVTIYHYTDQNLIIHSLCAGTSAKSQMSVSAICQIVFIAYA